MGRQLKILVGGALVALGPSGFGRPSCRAEVRNEGGLVQRPVAPRDTSFAPRYDYHLPMNFASPYPAYAGPGPGYRHPGDGGYRFYSPRPSYFLTAPGAAR
jgi:hypothetical protein